MEFTSTLASGRWPTYNIRPGRKRYPGPDGRAKSRPDYLHPSGGEGGRIGRANGRPDYLHP
jgi:hypothetical protein